MIKLNWYIIKTKLRSYCLDYSISTISNTIDRSIKCILSKKYSLIKILNSYLYNKAITLIFSVNNYIKVF